MDTTIMSLMWWLITIVTLGLISLVGNSSGMCTGDVSSTTGAFDGAAPTCECKRIIMLLLLDNLNSPPTPPTNQP